MAARFEFEGHPLYQEAMAFAYACMRRAQAFPVTYGAYGEDLIHHSLLVAKLVAAALIGRGHDLGRAREEAVACVPVIDLATTAGLLRDAERGVLRQRLTRLLDALDQSSVATPRREKERAS